MYNGCHDITYLNGGHYPSDDLELVTQREENILSIGALIQIMSIH